MTENSISCLGLLLSVKADTQFVRVCVCVCVCLCVCVCVCVCVWARARASAKCLLKCQTKLLWEGNPYVT